MFAFSTAGLHDNFRSRYRNAYIILLHVRLSVNIFLHVVEVEENKGDLIFGFGTTFVPAY